MQQLLLSEGWSPEILPLWLCVLRTGDPKPQPYRSLPLGFRVSLLSPNSPNPFSRVLKKVTWTRGCEPAYRPRAENKHPEPLDNHAKAIVSVSPSSAWNSAAGLLERWLTSWPGSFPPSLAMLCCFGILDICSFDLWRDTNLPTYTGCGG